MMNSILAFLIFLPILITSNQISFLGRSYEVAHQNGNYRFISTALNTITRYELASSVAFLAHNPGTGAYFLQLNPGDVINFDEPYTVERIDRYSVSGYYFTDLETNIVYDEFSIWMNYFGTPGILVLQTCFMVTPNNTGIMFIVGKR